MKFTRYQKALIFLAVLLACLLFYALVWHGYTLIRELLP